MNVLSDKYLVDTHHYLPYRVEEEGEASEGIKKFEALVTEVNDSWMEWMKDRGGSDIWADTKVLGLRFKDASALPENWTRINMSNQGYLVYAPKKGYQDYLDMRNLPERPTWENLFDGQLQAVDNGGIRLGNYVSIGKRKFLMVPRLYVTQNVGPVPKGADRIKWSEYFREAEIFDAPPAILNLEGKKK